MELIVAEGAYLVRFVKIATTNGVLQQPLVLPVARRTLNNTTRNWNLWNSYDIVIGMCLFDVELSLSRDEKEIFPPTATRHSKNESVNSRRYKIGMAKARQS